MQNSIPELFDRYAWSFFDQHDAMKEFASTMGDKHYFITGATGLFGTWLLCFMDWCHARSLAEPRVTNLVRRNVLPKRSYSTSLVGDLRDFTFPNSKLDRLIHLAAPSARDTFGGMTDRDKLELLYFGTRNILDFASKNIRGRCLLTSSGAIYGGFSADQQEPISETSRFAPLSSWEQIGLGIGKRVSEFLVTEYGRDGLVNPGIARCFSFIGPGLPADLHYAIGNFVFNAVSGKNIIINGDGTPIRSYMHLGDAIYWILAILEYGEPGDDFNVGSEEGISIAELAVLVRDCVNPNLEIEISGHNNVSVGNPPNHYYVPDNKKAKMKLNVKQTVLLRESIIEYGDYLREFIKK